MRSLTQCLPQCCQLECENHHNSEVVCGAKFGGECGPVEEVESDDEEESVMDGAKKATTAECGRVPSADSFLDLDVFFQNAELPFNAFRDKYLDKAPAPSETPKIAVILDDEPASPQSVTLNLVAVVVAPKARRLPDLKVILPDRCTDLNMLASPKTAPVQLSPSSTRRRAVPPRSSRAPHAMLEAADPAPHTPGAASPE